MSAYLFVRVCECLSAKSLKKKSYTRTTAAGMRRIEVQKKIFIYNKIWIKCQQKNLVKLKLHFYVLLFSYNRTVVYSVWYSYTCYRDKNVSS